MIVGHDRVEVIENNPEYMFRVEILESDITAASYPDVRKFIRKVKPSHLALLIVGRYWAEFPVDIVYASCLHMISEFYPRNNMQYLLLDGSWNLNGEYMLGGYRTGSLADFYPVCVEYLSSYKANGSVGGGRLQIAGGVRECLKVQGRCLELLSEAKVKGSYLLSASMQSLCMVGKGVESYLEIKGEVKEEVGVEEAPFYLLSVTEVNEEYNERFSSVSDCGAEITSGSRLRVEVDLWYLDGAESLDGSHSLKAEIIEYSAEEL